MNRKKYLSWCFSIIVICYILYVKIRATIYFKSLSDAFNNQYWALLIISVLLLLIIPILSDSISFYTVTRQEKADIKKRQAVTRKYYFATWIFAVSLVMNLLPGSTITKLGKNSLGLSEDIWLLVLLLGFGIIIFYFLISDREINEISIKDGKIQTTDSIEVVEGFDISIQDLELRIKGSYNVVPSLLPIFVETMESLKSNPEVDYIERLKLILKKYVDSINNIKSYNIYLASELEEHHLFNSDNIKEKLTDEKTWIGRKGSSYYMLIPFDTAYADEELIIEIECSNEPMAIEEYLIKEPIYIFEQLIAMPDILDQINRG